jgi:vacuolar-type H+-ATPase subunit E/Vma4
VKGEEYYQWSIKSQRGGTTYRQHVRHGSVRQSQLTHSKMSGAYAAVEAAEDEIASAGNVYDMKAALETCAEEIGNVRDEYQESLDNMPENLQQGDTGQQIQEKIDALESFADELTSVDLEEFGEEEPGIDNEAAHAKWTEDAEDHLEQQRSAALDALGNLSV